MINSGRASVPSSGQSWLGASIGDMISDDTVVRADGSVVGTLHYVQNFTGFDSQHKENQEGNFFPFRLEKKSKNNKMTFKKNGQVTQKDRAYDKGIIVRVGSNSDTFAVELDGEDYIALNFKQAILEGKT